MLTDLPSSAVIVWAMAVLAVMLHLTAKVWPAGRRRGELTVCCERRRGDRIDFAAAAASGASAQLRSRYFAGGAPVSTAHRGGTDEIARG